MPRRAAALALSLSLAQPLVAASPKDFERIPTEGLIRVMGRSGIAHACPAGGRLLTARHVLRGVWHWSPKAIAWEDQAGHGGRVVVSDEDTARDVVVLSAASQAPPLPSFTYPLASGFHLGEQVYILGYRFDAEHPTAPILVRAKITGSIAGHVFYDKTPGEGSSGGCVINAAGEVIAVNVGGLLKPKGLGGEGKEIIAGIGVLVIGQWRMNEDPKPLAQDPEGSVQRQEAQEPSKGHKQD